MFKEPDFSLGMENFIFDQLSTCNLQSVLEGSCLGCFVLFLVKTGIIGILSKYFFLVY